MFIITRLFKVWIIFQQTVLNVPRGDWKKNVWRSADTPAAPIDLSKPWKTRDRFPGGGDGDGFFREKNNHPANDWLIEVRWPPLFPLLLLDALSLAHKYYRTRTLRILPMTDDVAYNRGVKCSLPAGPGWWIIIIIPLPPPPSCR